MPTVLVVDDQRAPRRVLASRLKAAGFDVVQAADGRIAWEHFQRRTPQLVITDMAMPRSDGIDLAARIRECSEVPIVVFSAYASVPSAVQAVKAGANEFLSSSDLDVNALVQLSRDLCRGPAERPEIAAEFRGESPAIARVRARIGALAALRTPALLLGEPGTGRTTAAQLLHRLGPTAGLDFYKVDAARFQRSMSVPDCGMVLLHGIEELSLGGQELWAERLGGMSEDRPLRVVASSAGGLAHPRTEHSLIPDLASELLRFPIELPPLRSRPEDIPAIAEALLDRVSARLARPGLHLAAGAAQLLATQTWPGNATQLKQLLERAAAYCPEAEISEAVVRELLEETVESLAGLRQERVQSERDELLLVLRECGGNISRTAGRLGLSRQAVYRLIDKLQIPVGDRT